MQGTHFLSVWMSYTSNTILEQTGVPYFWTNSEQIQGRGSKQLVKANYLEEFDLAIKHIWCNGGGGGGSASFEWNIRSRSDAVKTWAHCRAAL